MTALMNMYAAERRGNSRAWSIKHGWVQGLQEIGAKQRKILVLGAVTFTYSVSHYDNVDLVFWMWFGYMVFSKGKQAICFVVII